MSMSALCSFYCFLKKLRFGRRLAIKQGSGAPMTTFRTIANWLQDSKGVATSLIEATATVAVGAVLAGVAVGSSIDAINNSKIQAAIADVSAIGQGVIT